MRFIQVLLIFFLYLYISSSESLYQSDEFKEITRKIIQKAIFEKDTVFQRLAYITDTYGPRLAGSTSLDKALDSIFHLMNEDGLNPLSESVMVPHFVRGYEYARMIPPGIRSKNISIIGLDGGKNPGIVKADAIVVRNFDELKKYGSLVKNKIVVYAPPWTSYNENVAYRYSGASEAEKYGALGCLIRSATPFSLYTLHAGSAARTSIPSACITVEDAELMKRMFDRGQRIVIEMYLEDHYEKDVESRNLIVEVKGSEKPDEIVLIGGHSDSWDIAEGATDDAAGAFMSWEAINLLHKLSVRPKRTIRGVLFVNEENGGRGGKKYAIDHKDEANLTSIAIEADTGYTRPFRLGFSGSDVAFDILKAMGKKYLSEIGTGNVTKTKGTGVDVYPTCALGVPCGLLEHLDQRDSENKDSNNPCFSFSSTHIDYEGELSIGYFWTHHSFADTPDKLNPMQLQLGAASLAIWSLGIANLDNLLPR